MFSREFGFLPSGERVQQYSFSNAVGARATILTYGGIVQRLEVPDRDGIGVDVVLGRDTLDEYLSGHPFFGAITGRIAGRVQGGIILVDGREYALPINSPPSHLHGGTKGLDKRIWTPVEQNRPDGADSLQLSYFSPDGEEGYPGSATIRVTYTLTEKSELIIETEVSVDRPTPVSLTNHSYFNLAGDKSPTVASHRLEIFADSFVPTDAAMIPLGRRELVAQTPEDFRRPRALAEAMPQLYKSHGGLYLLRRAGEPRPGLPTLSARLTEPELGRVLEVYTDDWCLQLYTASGFTGDTPGKNGARHVRHAGVCFECEGYPDASRVPAMGDIIVRPGSPQKRTTIYAFSNAAEKL